MVKAGNGVRGQTYGMTSENITVRNARIDYSGGIGVGVEVGAGVRNVTYRDIIMNNSIYGIKVQSERMMGGFMEDIFFFNVTLLNMFRPFVFWLDYNHHFNGTSNTPKWKNVFLDNIVTDNTTNTWLMANYVASCSNVIGMCNNATVFPYCPSCIKEETTCECPSGNWYQSSANPCNCFNFVQTPKTWPMANADCQQQNPKATLASIDSAFQNNDFWKQNNNVWAWNNNDSSVYRNWRSGYPVGGSATYAELNKNDGKWTNIIGSVTGCYVCEIKNM
uniref:C-type lectin domain-containing protein n=1 Tax=Acrobeloides nanus TaxID=290746 RepID=A0A914DQX8_9BILA